MAVLGVLFNMQHIGKSLWFWTWILWTTFVRSKPVCYGGSYQAAVAGTGGSAAQLHLKQSHPAPADGLCELTSSV